MSVLTIFLGAALAAATFATVGAQQRSANDAIFTAEQAKRGVPVYTEMCAACHDPALVGGVGPALAGKEFLAVWKDQSVGALFEKIKNEMPLTAPGTMTPEQTADVTAYMLEFNKFPAGATPLSLDPAPLKEVKVGEPGAAAAGTTTSTTAAPATGAAPAAGAVAVTGAAAATGGGAGLYTDAQSRRGESVYMDMCAACHDPKLSGGVGPALAGKEFLATWKGESVGELFDRIRNTMPLTAPGTMTPEQTADVLAFLLSSNHYPAGAEMKTDSAALKAVPLGEPQK